MAINYVISYTFAPNTTISSSNVNTNFADNANTWTGLEALTKTFAKLKVDVDPSTALEVATKQYVDHYAQYRKPVMQYSSGTVANIETGSGGTSGAATVLFPGGDLRSDSTAGHIQIDLTRVAALSGAAQSGLQTGTVATNTWYYCYAVKTSDNSSNFVGVADTVLPLVANYATLNSNYGTGSWVPLGLIRNGDNSGATNAILSFVQSGNFTIFSNTCSGNSVNKTGIRIASTASAATLTYTYAAGTGTTQIPANITNVIYAPVTVAGSSPLASDTGGNHRYVQAAGAILNIPYASIASDGSKLTLGATGAADIYLAAFWDSVLGVGSNPTL